MYIIPSGLKQPRAKHITAGSPGELCLLDLNELTSLNEIVTSFSLSLFLINSVIKIVQYVLSKWQWGCYACFLPVYAVY